MKIKSVDNTSFVEMIPSSDNTGLVEYADDLAVDVEVYSSEGFCGKCSKVWFQRSTLDEFIQSLQTFELTRRGSVTLSACPQSEFNEFELKLSSINVGQTILAEIQLLKVAYTPDDRLEPFRVSAHFTLDPSMLCSIVSDFKDLFETRRS